jgi:O-antigen ligase
MPAVAVIVAFALRWAVPAMLAALIAAPGLALLISGRDIQNPESLDPGNLNATAEWLLRLATLGIVGLSALILLDRSQQTVRRPPDSRQLALLTGVVTYFIGIALLPGLFGAEPHMPRIYFFVLALFLAVLARRADGVGRVLDVTKWTLFFFMAAGIGLAFVNPDAALRTYAAEVRLPVVWFRFWGLGPSANSTGPLALIMLMVLIARPFQQRWLNMPMAAIGGIVFVLAQSQTAWIAGAIILPGMLMYRRGLAQGHEPKLRIRAESWLILGGLAAGALVLALSMIDFDGRNVLPTAGLQGYGELLTGRGSIWRVAWKIFLEHPIFGYGLKTWTLDFRTALGMTFATSAHNQWLQGLSVGGVCGFVGVNVYLASLVYATRGRAVATVGLAPALLMLQLMRCLTEAPLDLGTLLVADVFLQVLLLALLVDRGEGADPGLPVRQTMRGAEHDEALGPASIHAARLEINGRR